MSEKSQQSTDEGSGEPIGGARLAAARVANEISSRDIAKELHLDEPTVLALEQNNFDMLGAPVFAKGHLRKYAELVGVPVEDILADYYQMNRATGAPPVVGRPRSIGTSVSPGPWIAAAFVVIAAIAAAFWWYTRAPATPATQAAVATLAPQVPDTLEEPVQDLAVDASDGSRAAQTDGAADAAPLAAPVEASLEPLVDELQAPPEEAILLPQVRVELSFSGNCWTEVTDASGRRLFYDLGTAGQVVSLSGDEPLELVLGDSSNVSMTADGQDYPVPLPRRSGSLTRLTINSQ